jgi:hypothetical protein
MRFQLGDATDEALCIALQHEFLRCEDAFDDFVSSSRIMIIQGENPRIAYRAYNAYARFVHHLYEFVLGAVARERQNTEQLKFDMADCYVGSEIQRLLTNRREAIINGTAPAWENHISVYPESIPKDLPLDFRRCRNIVSGHVKYERTGLNLSDFYDKYHTYLYMLYEDIKSWWGRLPNRFPDLKEITAFSVLVKDKPLP